MDRIHPEREFMDAAVALAHDAVASGRGGPFGAVVVRDGRIVGRGQNRVPSELDPTAHAEVVAIRDACRNLGDFRLAGCVLYSSCEPCPMCLAAALWSRLDAVVFAGTRADAAAAGFDDASFYALLEAGHAGRLPLVPFRREDALPVFAAWLAKADRVRY